MQSDKKSNNSEFIFEKATEEQIREFRLDYHLINFMKEEPFFSTILRHIRRERTHQIPTAGVTVQDGSYALYWNPEFLASLSNRKIMGLLRHECYHLIFKHCTTRSQKPHQMWNIATDLAINSIIDASDLPDGGLIPGIALKGMDKITDPAQKDVWVRLSELIKGFPRDMSSEWYMEKLKNDEELQDAMDKVPDDGGGSGSGSCGMPGMDDHEGWGEGLSSEAKDKLEGELKDILGKATKEADQRNGWGSVPSEMRGRIRSMVSGAVDWKNILSQFIGRRQRAKKSSTHRRINRKYPYIHPGKKIGHTSNLAVYLDQSGSVSDADIEMFAGVLNSLAKHASFTFFNFDFSVDESSKFAWKKNKKLPTVNRTRCGGTNFNAVEMHYRKVKDTYDGYIVLTDGEAPKPPPCISRRCWVILPNCKLYFKPDSKDIVAKMDTKKRL